MPRPFVFALLALATSAVGCGSRTPPTSPAELSARFTDVTAPAGITFRHVNGADGRKLLPETMGGGVVVLDFDADGKPDLFFVNSRNWPGSNGAPAHPALYRNNGNGSFADVTAAVGLNVEMYGMGGCAGDFDNDGFPDLFVSAVGGNRLFRNAGGKKFEDVTERAGLKNDSWPTATDTEFFKWDRPVSFPASATWIDYDGDARLDLFVCEYVAWSPATDLGINAVLPGGKRAYVPPTQFPGAQCRLFRNLGGGRFEDASFAAGVEVTEPSGMNGARQPVAKALGVVACDPDADGWPDLLVANDTARNFFFHNVPDGTGRKFEEVGLTANAAYVDGRPRGGMGIDAAEVAPGRFAAVVANFSNEPNTLLTLARQSPPLFRDAAAADGLAAPSRGPMKFGAFFFDYDGDGRPDLLTANGHLEPDIAAARPGQTHPESAQLFRNVGGKFEPVANAGDLSKPVVGRGSAYLDCDGDGDLDVVIAANGGPAKLFRNDAGGGNKWVRLKLVGDGGKSNRDAIGATVEVTVGDEVRRTFVTGSRGYLSQSELVVTIGLGDRAKADAVTVRWPGKAGGTQTWHNLDAGREHRLEQK